MTGATPRPFNFLEARHGLQVSRESAQALSAVPETGAHFAAGFAPKGVRRGRLTIPIHDRADMLLAYRGRAVKDESPSLIFPDRFDRHGAIFNAHRIVNGDLFLVHDPLHALTAHESGIENVVAFLAENVTALQPERLAALTDE